MIDQRRLLKCRAPPSLIQTIACMSLAQNPAPEHEENQLILERREKLKALRQAQADGKGVAFPNDFKPSDQACALFDAHAGQTPEGLREQGTTARVAGRMMLKRVMGKASFATLQDSTGRIQIYVKGEDVEIGRAHV